MDFQAVHAGQFPLVRPAKGFKGAAPSSFLKALKTALPVVAEQTFLQRHAGQLLRFLNLYRAGTPVTRRMVPWRISFDLYVHIYIYSSWRSFTLGTDALSWPASRMHARLRKQSLLPKLFEENARCAWIFFLGRKFSWRTFSQGGGISGKIKESLEPF